MADSHYVAKQIDNYARQIDNCPRQIDNYLERVLCLNITDKTKLCNAIHCNSFAQGMLDIVQFWNWRLGIKSVHLGCQWNWLNETDVI